MNAHTRTRTAACESAADGDTADLRRGLWLAPMNASTRQSTLGSLARLQAAAGGTGEIPVSRVRELVETPDPRVKAAVGARWSQVASDARRALRAWDDAPTRWLALRLRDRVPTLAEAAMAAEVRLGRDEAMRARRALEALARAQGGALGDVPATRATLEPLLRAATPETFGVSAMKSLENKRTLLRRAVGLVDPLSGEGRQVRTAALPAAWRAALEAVGRHMGLHDTSSPAILRRLAAFAARHGTAPQRLDAGTLDTFVSLEMATHAQDYAGKLRAAFRRWNAAAEAGEALPQLPLPGAPQHRLDDVAWEAVPEGIREPLDAFLARAVSLRHPGDWGAFVPETEVDAAYADLGVVFAPEVASAGTEAAHILEVDTQRNWRDAVKRAWHAAALDPRVAPTPETLEALFCQPVIAALVAAVRHSRRARLEAAGRSFDPAKKERYEHGLVEVLCAVGRALSVDPERLAAVEELKRQLDPAVVGLRRNADGTVRRVYAQRRIGARHATMLAAFSDLSRLKRWFEAPGVLWRLACRPVEAGRTPRPTEVALARSALVARIGQYVAPIRRGNLARLRWRGDDRHILLPEGDGEGTLRIPAREGKTLREIHVRIDRETVRMLKAYIRTFLPVAQRQAGAAPDNPHLFPGADGARAEDGGYAPGQGYLTKGKLNTSFSAHMRKHCGLTLCLHVMRHLAGKVILDQDPSAMSLVQEILGHKRLKTTQSYYAEVSKIVAQRRYLHLLERQSRQVLANVTFRVVDTGRGGQEV